MKKDVPFVWDKACHNPFERIKKYLANPPILGALMAGKPLILYIAAQKCSLGALFAQQNEENKENTLYYLSQTLMGSELNYSLIEKTCLALIFSTKKLRHYTQAYIVHLIAHTDPIKYVLSKPILSGRLARWGLLLIEYEIIYIPQKVIKGQRRLLGRSSYSYNMKNFRQLPRWGDILCWRFSFVDDVLW